LDLVQNFLILTACLFLLFIAWEDFLSFRIRNRSVLILLGLYAVFALSRGSLSPVPLDLAAGLLLFVIGFVFWLLKLVGAGDVKLYFAVGCWVSLPNLGGWALLLLLCSLIMLLVVKMPFPMPMRHLSVVMRLDELRKGKQVPYAVPITFATVISLLPNAFA
jgi:prepilin peptidase CpaA